MNLIIISILAFIGLTNAFYIFWKKRLRQRLVCVIGSDCNKVIQSSYASMFGVDNTVLGMAYYLFLLFAITFGRSFVSPPFFSWSLGIAMSMAASFSLYLLYAQLALLREWCDYCLLAALINISLEFAFFA